jgi:hypothetical protein
MGGGGRRGRGGAPRGGLNSSARRRLVETVPVLLHCTSRARSARTREYGQTAQQPSVQRHGGGGAGLLHHPRQRRRHPAACCWPAAVVEAKEERRRPAGSVRLVPAAGRRVLRSADHRSSACWRAPRPPRGAPRDTSPPPSPMAAPPAPAPLPPPHLSARRPLSRASLPLYFSAAPAPAPRAPPGPARHAPHGGLHSLRRPGSTRHVLLLARLASRGALHSLSSAPSSTPSPRAASSPPLASSIHLPRPLPAAPRPLVADMLLLALSRPSRPLAAYEVFLLEDADPTPTALRPSSVNAMLSKARDMRKKTTDRGCRTAPERCWAGLRPSSLRVAFREKNASTSDFVYVGLSLRAWGWGAWDGRRGLAL